MKIGLEPVLIWEQHSCELEREIFSLIFGFRVASSLSC